MDKAEGLYANLLNGDLVPYVRMERRRLEEARRHLHHWQASARVLVKNRSGVYAERKKHLVQSIDHPARVVGKEHNPAGIAFAPVQASLIAIGTHDSRTPSM